MKKITLIIVALVFSIHSFAQDKTGSAKKITYNADSSNTKGNFKITWRTNDQGNLEVRSEPSQVADSAKSIITIRGINGFNKANDPVIILDGEKIDQSAFSLLNAENIKAITILKKDNAIAEYGIEASYGAIVITTKSAIAKTANLEHKLNSLVESNVADLEISSSNKDNQADSLTSTKNFRIKIRGVDNFNPDINEPVYILNGEKIDKIGMSSLNPNSIESITILKKNSSIAEYGLEAINGVVIIKTKSLINRTATGKSVDKN